MLRRMARGGAAIALIGVLAFGLAPAGSAVAHSEEAGAVASAGPMSVDDAMPQWHGRGVVRVTKVVTGDGAPTDVAFDICLTGPLPDGPERCKTLTGAGTITFHDLKPGTYALAERDVPAGFAVSYSASEFVVVKDRFTDVTVTNHYTPPMPEVGRAEVTKIVTGDDAPDDAVYEICLIGPLPDDTAHCRSVTGGATAVFDDLPTGTYTLTEPDPPTGVDVTYSTPTVEIIGGQTATASVTNHSPPPDVESQTPPPTTPPTTAPPPTTPPPTTAPPTTAPPTVPPPPTPPPNPPTVGPETETQLPETGSGIGLLVTAALLAGAGAVALRIGRRPAPTAHRSSSDGRN